MVRPGARVLAAAWLALAPALACAAGLSPTAQVDALPVLPGRPAPLQRQPNVLWEDFAATTLVSLPFTAFWALLGALAVGGISQSRFPPELDTPMLLGAAAVAGGTSVGIGLISVSWGGSSPREPGADE